MEGRRKEGAGEGERRRGGERGGGELAAAERSKRSDELLKLK